MRIATIASAAILGLSTAALATGVTGSPLQTVNNSASANTTTPDTSTTPATPADNSTDTSAIPDNTAGTGGNTL